MSVLNFFLVNSTLINILFSLAKIVPIIIYILYCSNILSNIYNASLGTRICLDFSKVSHLNLESQNYFKNIPVVLPSTLIKIWGKSVKRFLSYDRTYKQTNRDYKYLKEKKTQNNFLQQLCQMLRYKYMFINLSIYIYFYQANLCMDIFGAEKNWWEKIYQLIY